MIEAEKTTEKEINEAQNEKESELQRIKKQGQDKIDENNVKIHEKEEEKLSMKEIEKIKVIYELELYEWGTRCTDLQDSITKIKYDNQIKMAETKTAYEHDYDMKLEDFKLKAQNDAQRSKC